MVQSRPVSPAGFYEEADAGAWSRRAGPGSPRGKPTCTCPRQTNTCHPETREHLAVTGQHGARLLPAAFGTVSWSPTEFTATSQMDTCRTRLQLECFEGNFECRKLLGCLEELRGLAEGGWAPCCPRGRPIKLLFSGAGSPTQLHSVGSEGGPLAPPAGQLFWKTARAQGRGRRVPGAHQGLPSDPRLRARLTPLHKCLVHRNWTLAPAAFARFQAPSSTSLP